MTNFEELNNNFDLNKFKEFKPNAKDLTFTFKEKILFNNVYMQESISDISTFKPLKTSFNLEGQQILEIENFNFEELHETDQTLILIEDCLNILLGINGNFIGFNIDRNTNTIELVMSNLIPIRYLALVEQITKGGIFLYYIKLYLNQFSKYKFGLVHQALGASINLLLEDYYLLVNQLEFQLKQKTLTNLSQLIYYLNSNLLILEYLTKLLSKFTHPDVDEQGKVTEVLVGAKVIDYLYDQMLKMSGFQTIKSLYGYLLSQTIIPYLSMTYSWIFRAELTDPFNEFLVYLKTSTQTQAQNQQNLTNLSIQTSPQYQQATLNTSNLPSQLELEEKKINPEDYEFNPDNLPKIMGNLGEKIWLSGKHLLLLKSCGVRLDSSIEDKLPEIKKGGVNCPDYIKAIDTAYSYANTTLLNYIFREENLMDRLLSLKHYFLLDQSDFITHFIDLCQEDLQKIRGKINFRKIQSMLDLALRNPSSVNAFDPYREDIRVEFKKTRLVDQALKVIKEDSELCKYFDNGMEESWSAYNDISGIGGGNRQFDTFPDPLQSSVGREDQTVGTRLYGYESLSFSYNITSPLSIIIPPLSHSKYQLLFRQLFQVKYCELELIDSWVYYAKLIRNTKLPSQFIIIQSLRHKMLNFIQILENYLTLEAIETNSIKLSESLKNVRFSDDVKKIHDGFLNDCLKQSMLVYPDLLGLMQLLLDLIVKFSYFLNDTLFIQLSLVVGGSDNEFNGNRRRNANGYDFSKIDFSKVFELDKDFQQNLSRFIKKLRLWSVNNKFGNLGLGNLATKLDFNEIYDK